MNGRMDGHLVESKNFGHPSDIWLSTTFWEKILTVSCRLSLNMNEWTDGRTDGQMEIGNWTKSKNSGHLSDS
jgi:hypothetical protein